MPQVRACRWTWSVVVAGLLAFAGSASAQPRRVAAWGFGEPEPVSGLRLQGTPGAATSGPTVGGRRLQGNNAESEIVPTRMCVRLWYRPKWSSADTERGSGKGPGRKVCLLAIGDRDRDPESGWWEWSIVPDGTRLEFSCSAGGGEVYSVTSDPVRFREGKWAELVLSTFDSRVQALNGDGMFLWKSPGRLPAPKPSALRRGIGLGGRVGEPSTAEGEVARVEVYDAALARVEMYKSAQVMSAVPGPDDRGLRVLWRIHPQIPFELERASEVPAGTPAWTVLDRGVERGEFLDTTAEAGRAYLYRVVTNRQGLVPPPILRAGLRLPPVEQRGVVALLVDDTLAKSLNTDLDRWERDLQADGWQTVRQPVPRHDDEDWSKNPPAIAKIRAVIGDLWRSRTNALRGVILVGHVAIPYSGMYADDGHTGKGDNHFGAWPCDVYYGDVDGVWTDKLDYPNYLPTTTYPATGNRPGDGKFDSNFIAPNAAGVSRQEIAVGRLDFAGLPVLGRGRSAEVDLIRKYLDKVHRYRVGETPALPRAVAAGYFNSGADFAVFYNAFRNGSRLYGFRPEDLFEASMFDLGPGQESQWGFLAGAGAIDRVMMGSPSMVTSSTLADPKRQPRVLFAMLMGSWFGDWAAGENNLLRTLVASRDYGLAALWTRWGVWHLDPLARGGTLGEAQVLTANESMVFNDENRGTARVLSILGDPTLRLHTTAPPRSFRGQRSGDTVRLSWQSSRDAQAGYAVYRAAGGRDGEWERLSAPGWNEREFTDDHAPAGASYLVRAAQVISTGSGSYTNLSLGLRWPEAGGR